MIERACHAPENTPPLKKPETPQPSAPPGVDLPPPDCAALHGALARQCAARGLQATDYFKLKARGSSFYRRSCVCCCTAVMYTYLLHSAPYFDLYISVAAVSS
jgi:hypothetical protein